MQPVWKAPTAPTVVALLAFAVNANVLGNGFVYDDGAQILNNPYIHSPRYLGKIFSTNVWSFIGPEGTSNYYRPLMHVINMITYGLFGLRPAAYHMTSILFHVGCCLMVYWIGRRLFSEQAALLAALFFAVHPIHTEAVAWIASVADPACGFFFLLSFYLYLRGRPVWSAAAALPALLMKETAVMLLPVILVYQLSTKEGAKKAMYHLVPLAVVLALRWNALGGLVMVANPYVLPLDSRIYSMVYLAGKYLWKLMAPWPFNIFHVFHAVTSPADPRFLGAVALLGMTAAGAFWLWRRGSNLWFAVVWILVPLVPVLYISRLGDNVFTERYLYLPSVGFCWLLAAAFGDRKAAVLFLLMNYSLLTWFRNSEWRDDVTLYTLTLQVSPESSLIRFHLGNAYLAGGMPEQALPLLIQAASERPGDAQVWRQLRQAQKAIIRK